MPKAPKKAKPAETPEFGTLHPRESLFLLQQVGTASSGRDKYTVGTTMSFSPMIRSQKTGRYFNLSWEDIVNLAIIAGIDKES